jgi:hypothetical protein
MGFDRDDTCFRGGREATNNWLIGQGGFRADWLPSSGERLSLQGGFYGGATEQLAPGDVTLDGPFAQSYHFKLVPELVLEVCPLCAPRPRKAVIVIRIPYPAACSAPFLV